MPESLFRISTALIMLSAFSISAYFRKKADKESGETIPRKVDGTTLMTIIKIGGLILWLTPVLFIVYPQALAWSKMGLADSMRIIGIILGILCVPMIYWLFSSIGNSISPTSATRKEHKLVTSGPYRWIRHPLYTVGSTVFVAFGLMADSWLIIVMAVLVFIIMAVRTPKEEANLIEKFGDEYKEYMKQTGRFFPRLFKGSSCNT